METVHPSMGEDMYFVVIGIDHRAQPSDCGLEALLRAFLHRRYYEPLIAIAEEWDTTKGESIGQRLARRHKLRWYNPDLTNEEKVAEGIWDEQADRRRLRGVFRVPSDTARETAWVEKLTESTDGTTVVLCGYLHFDALASRLRAAGHAVETRVYVDVVPEIRSLTSEELKVEVAKLQSEPANLPAP
jgi:hypothetical protein